MKASTALVIGGGVVGLNVALALQERGLAVTIVDAPGERPPPSWGNAGRIANELVAPLASIATVRGLPSQLFLRGGPASFPPRAIAAWLPFGLRLLRASAPARFEAGTAALRALMAGALPAWQRRVAALGRPDLLVEAGHWTIWESQATAARGRASWTNEDIGTATLRDPTEDELATLSARFSARVAGALRFEGTAQIADPTELLAALATSFISRGGTIEKRTATRDDETRADVTIVAAGVTSRALLERHGHRVPMIAERGYHIQSVHATWPAGFPSLYFEDRAVVVTGFRGGLRATSFVEFGRAGAPPDVRKWERLEAHVRELGLPFGSAPARWVGSRPTLPDYLPAIGRSARTGNLYYAFGHQHLGLTLAATTGERLASLIIDGEDAAGLRAFDVARFG